MIFSQKRQENKEEKIKVKAYLLWEKDGKPEEISDQYYWHKAIEQDKKENSLTYLFQKWGHQIEKCPEFILARMQQSKILKIIILLGNLSVGIAATTFIVTDKQRHDLKIIQSWQIINSASGKSSNGGMKKALEFLNSNRKSPYDRGQRRFPVFWKHWTPQALNRLDAPNIYLRGIKLPGAFLDEANFQNTDLGYANLERANLKDANLQEAILESSNLQSAFLLNANLQKSTLKNANLIGATLLSANLMDANLNGSDLRGATLQMANLKNAKLYRAKLEYTVLWQADLEGAFLGDANLEKQSLRGVNLKNAIMWGANLQGAELDGVFLEGAYLTGANLKGATVVVVPGFPKAVFMQEAKLIGTNLDQVNLSAVDLRKAIYSDMDTHPSVCERYQLQSPCPTIFPKGFNPKAAGMIKVHLEEISKR